MSAAAIALPVLGAFALASVVLAVTPGPGVLYIVTRTLSQGRRAGLASVGGVALGNLGNALGTSLGLAALWAASAPAFNAVKFAGAAYLIYLGIKALRSAAPAQDAVVPPPTPLAKIFRDGFLVALLNPKTALFFAAFLPQFIDPAASAAGQSVAFGVAFVAIAACTDSGYVLAAGIVRPRLGGFGKASLVGRYLSALVYFGLGIFAAISGQRTSK